MTMLPKAPAINVQEVITLTARLAQLLAEEVDLLGAAKISKIDELQKEKQYLITALENHRRQLDKHPHLVETIPSRDKKDLEAVVQVFQNILEENHRKLLVAREVNKNIVRVITEVVRDSSVSHVYDGQGHVGGMGNEALSITLNHTA